jgi:hypothetical protein
MWFSKNKESKWYIKTKNYNFQRNNRMIINKELPLIQEIHSEKKEEGWLKISKSISGHPSWIVD